MWYGKYDADDEPRLRESDKLHARTDEFSMTAHYARHDEDEGESLADRVKRLERRLGIR